VAQPATNSRVLAIAAASGSPFGGQRLQPLPQVRLLLLEAVEFRLEYFGPDPADRLERID
jgi:hypothetical protein